MVNEPNPYAALGLMPGSSQAEIKRRYRQMAKRYHPDCNGPESGSEEKLRDLNAAYAFLSDPARKAAYDASFAAAFDPLFHAHSAPLRPAQTTVYAFAPLRRRKRSVHAAGLVMLMLLSTGVGVLVSAVNGSSALTGLLTRTFSKSTAPERPAPVYTFVPSSDTFDDQSASQTSAGTDQNSADQNSAGTPP